jgi:hypothetical protein
LKLNGVQGLLALTSPTCQNRNSPGIRLRKFIEISFELQSLKPEQTRRGTAAGLFRRPALQRGVRIIQQGSAIGILHDRNPSISAETSLPAPVVSGRTSLAAFV